MTDGTVVNLDYRNRYLLVVRDTGRVWWPALNQTRLTQFGIGLIKDKIKFAGKSALLDFDGLGRDIADANVELRLRLEEDDPPLVIRAWFDIQGITLFDPAERNPPIDHFGFRWLSQQTKTQADEFKKLVIERLLRGFKYKRNRNGYTATEALGAERENFKIRLHKYNGHYFLVIE